MPSIKRVRVLKHCLASLSHPAAVKRDISFRHYVAQRIPPDAVALHRVSVLQKTCKQII
jgi:hypothetical protein